MGAAPLEPVALTPEAGAVFSTRPDTFSWQEVSGADSYDLFVYDRTSLSVVHRNSNIGNEICISGVCTYTIDTYDLTYSANHVWRVRSVNVSGSSPFSYSQFDLVSQNGPAFAQADSAIVEFGGAVSVPVLVNDDTDGTLDPDSVLVIGSTLAVVQTDGTVGGTAIVYTHDGSGSVGDEITFTYTVSDDDGEPSNEATVTVTITEAPNVATVTIAPIGDSITNGGNGRPSYRRALWQKLQQAGYDVDFVGSKNTFFGNGPPASELDFDLDHEGHWAEEAGFVADNIDTCLLYTSPSPRDRTRSRMPSSA